MQVHIGSPLVAAGVIDAIGSSVTDFVVDDRVAYYG